MFRLDLNATNQLCVLPVIKCQAIHRSHTKKEPPINACLPKKEHTNSEKNQTTHIYIPNSVVQKRYSTFSSEIRLERFLLLKVFKQLDDTVALSDGISIHKNEMVQKLTL